MIQQNNNTAMKISGLGEVTKDERFGWYYSQPIKLSVLDGHECQVVLEGYDEEPVKEDYHAVIGTSVRLNCCKS
jgi:hypothetical protein